MDSKNNIKAYMRNCICHLNENKQSHFIQCFIHCGCGELKNSCTNEDNFQMCYGPGYNPRHIKKDSTSYSSSSGICNDCMRPFTTCPIHCKCGTIRSECDTYNTHGYDCGGKLEDNSGHISESPKYDREQAYLMGCDMNY